MGEAQQKREKRSEASEKKGYIGEATTPPQSVCGTATSVELKLVPVHAGETSTVKPVPTQQIHMRNVFQSPQTNHNFGIKWKWFVQCRIF